MLVGRSYQKQIIDEIMKDNRSSFVAITGRRRVGKTFLVEETMGGQIAFRVTGIQDAPLKMQLANFAKKVFEHANTPFDLVPNNWQEAFALLRQYLQTLSKNKKRVLFFDELPWMNTHKSGFIQLFAHFWNDYLSKEKHFVLVICGSATSWIYKNIQNDKGGFHNRITHRLHLEPFTLGETQAFLASKNFKWTPNAIAELYMILGGIPFYLDRLKKGESVAANIDRLFFGKEAVLANEYDNLYKALFENPHNHEAVVEALAGAQSGMNREELMLASKVQNGGPINRTLDDLVTCGFVSIDNPLGKIRRGSIYRLNDEFSYFYHKFLSHRKASTQKSWLQFSQSQAYKIWSGYAFENLCKKHVQAILKKLGISGIYTETAAYRKTGNSDSKGFQIDLIIDRNDKAINLCECKYLATPMSIDKKYAQWLMERKSLFIQESGTNKLVFTTLITNLPIIENQYCHDVVDVALTVGDLF